MNYDHDSNELDPKLAERFSKLREISARNPQRAATGRAAFLSQARELSQKNPRPVPVTPTPWNRLMVSIRTIPEAFGRSVTQPMFTRIMAVLIAAVLVFSGAAATAYASQASLPNDALYGVKTFGENLRLSLAPQANDKLSLALAFTQRRVDEMMALSEIGVEIPPHFATQYLEQVEYTLRLAAGLPNDRITLGLEQIRTRLQEQLRILEQLNLMNPDDPTLLQLQEQLRIQLRLAELGLGDPQRFREQIRLQQVQQTEEPLATEEPSATSAPDPADQNNNANTNGNANVNFNANENANANANHANGNNNANGNGNANDDRNTNDDNGKDDDGKGKGNGNNDDDDRDDDNDKD